MTAPRDTSVRITPVLLVHVRYITARSAGKTAKPTATPVRLSALTSKSSVRESAPAGMELLVRWIAIVRKGISALRISAPAVSVRWSTVQSVGKTAKPTATPVKLDALTSKSSVRGNAPAVALEISAR